MATENSTSPELVSKKESLEQLVQLSPIDTSRLTQFSTEGGESIIFLTSPDYSSPNHPTIPQFPSSELLIKSLNEPKKETSSQLNTALTVYDWFLLSPSTLHSPSGEIISPDNLSDILCTQFPTEADNISKLIAHQQRTHGTDNNRVDRINRFAAKQSVRIGATTIKSPQIFPFITDFGLSQNLHWYITLQKVTPLLDTLPQNKLGIAKFDSFFEANQKLRIPELTAIVSVMRHFGFTHGDIKAENLGITPDNHLTILDPNLTKNGLPLLHTTHEYLPPEVRAKLPELPIAHPSIDEYAIKAMRQQSVGKGV